MFDVLKILWRQRSSRGLSIAVISLFTLGAGMGPWYAAFMMRSHAMNTADLGIWLGLIFGLGGIAGILLGGYVTTSFFANNEGRQMRLSAMVIASLTPFFILFLLVPERDYALLALIPLVVVFNFFVGPTFALMQRLVRDEMRATALAVVMLLANLIGMGIGPQVVGMLSDTLVPFSGSDSLRYAMLTMSLIALFAAYQFWQVEQTIKEDLLQASNQLRSDRDDVKHCKASNLV